ncbi:hypothetical protein ACFOET_03670 [Parapedobacter deserti]|uniref:Dihydrofolate reductase n=1 Tax=Parapedobacter deserti TaxID=1912957 RepID=A0ABV7JFF2_9SPHI
MKKLILQQFISVDGFCADQKTANTYTMFTAFGPDAAGEGTVLHSYEPET